MLSFLPAFPADRSPRFLFIGAHSDDLEIGCGGAAIELLRRVPSVDARWIVLSGSGERGGEARSSATALLRGAGTRDISVARFRDGYFPEAYADLKDFFEMHKKTFRPDLIFTHSLQDRHQDHRLVAELTWNTWRHSTILEYEIPKYEGHLGSPNVYFPLALATVRRKTAHFMRHFRSQRSRAWFSNETFRAHLRLRGIECNAKSGFAEAFAGRKVCL